MTNFVSQEKGPLKNQQTSADPWDAVWRIGEHGKKKGHGIHDIIMDLPILVKSPWFITGYWYPLNICQNSELEAKAQSKVCEFSHEILLVMFHDYVNVYQRVHPIKIP